MKPDETIKVIEMASQGNSQRYMAKEVGSSPATINREVNKPEIASQIKQLAESYIIESVPTIVERHKSEAITATKLQE